MKWVISRYNHDLDYLRDYTDDAIIYDRSDNQTGYLFLGTNIVTQKVPNIGSDIYDKFTFIIDNYDNLPDIAVYTKANIFKYINRGEFNKLKDTTEFTPLLTQYHPTDGKVNFYKDKMYYEINNYWYLGAHPARFAQEIIDFFDMNSREYNAFAPGSNYILPKENILKHPKSVYETLRSYLNWAVYPGDAQLIERNLYYLWS